MFYCGKYGVFFENFIYQKKKAEKMPDLLQLSTGIWLINQNLYFRRQLFFS